MDTHTNTQCSNRIFTLHYNFRTRKMEFHRQVFYIVANNLLAMLVPYYPFNGVLHEYNFSVYASHFVKVSIFNAVKHTEHFSYFNECCVRRRHQTVEDSDAMMTKTTMATTTTAANLSNQQQPTVTFLERLNRSDIYAKMFKGQILRPSAFIPTHLLFDMPTLLFKNFSR